MIHVSRALAVALAVLAAPAEADAKPTLAPGEKIELNHATVEELMKLPGVGRKRAEAIAALRERRPFRRPEDLALVKGISPAWVAKHRGFLDVAAPAAPARAAAKP